MRRMTSPMVTIFLLFLAVAMVPGSALAQQQGLGELEFANSGAAEAQEPFIRGLLLLHSFEYDDAREAFQAAREIDPGFAMAYWGEAQTHNHPIWQQQDRDAARAALAELGATAEARYAKAGTGRERDYLRTLEVMYGEGGKRDRDYAYSDAMQRLMLKYPDDADARAFYALSILGQLPLGLDGRRSDALGGGSGHVGATLMGDHEAARLEPHLDPFRHAVAQYQRCAEPGAPLITLTRPVDGNPALDLQDPGPDHVGATPEPGAVGAQRLDDLAGRLVPVGRLHRLLGHRDGRRDGEQRCEQQDAACSGFGR
ncbi:MAG TPA: hypothetical protein QGG47_06485 [Acidobacteriota bacterium]|nr:hypothetical protein [Acidobacteriota bacterium]